jgi:hypothetical protein
MGEAFIYKEYLPENAQVLVDYTQPPKDRVKFLYVKERTYNQALMHGGLNSFLNFWFVQLMLIAIPIGIFIFGIMIGFGIGYVIIHPSIILYSLNTLWQPNYSTTTQATAYPGLILAIVQISSIMLIPFGVPILALLIASRDKELLARMVPKMNYNCAKWMGTLKKTTIKPEDIYDNKFAIPYFHNVYLDYQASGDFSKYLEKVEVLAIPFSWEWLNPKKRKPPKNEYDFRTLFVFSQRPENGQMDIIFH